MKTFTFQEVIDFAKKQNPSKPIDMSEIYYDSECGCLINQFAKSKGIKFGRVNFEGNRLLSNEKEVCKIEGIPGNNIMLACGTPTHGLIAFDNYGDLIKLFQEKGYI